jgi:predicted ester cyclase
MSTDKNKEVVRRYFEDVWGRAEPSVAEQVVHTQITVVYPSLREPLHGRAALLELATSLVESFPDLRVYVDELIGEGDNVVARWTTTGTHRGRFGNITPTGRGIRWTGISICRMMDGKVVEERGEEDFSGLLRQLGLKPTPR